MKRVAALGILGLGLMVSPLLRTATSAVPAQPKVGVVDIEQVLMTSPGGKKATAAFEASKKKKQDELDKKKKDFLQANADFEKQKSVLKDDAKQKKQAELEKSYAELGKYAADLERDLAKENAKMSQDLMKAAEPIIKDLAKAEGLTMLIDAHEVIWFDPAMDLTSKLSAKMP